MGTPNPMQLKASRQRGESVPFINETRCYGLYQTKNEAMKDILTDNEIFDITWYALRVSTGRKQCPGNRKHETKNIQKSQICLAADFNSIIKKDGIFKVKDVRRLFCSHSDCLTHFDKRGLRDFSNLKSPTEIHISRLDLDAQRQLKSSLSSLNITFIETQ